jgi:hypothetical protein
MTHSSALFIASAVLAIFAASPANATHCTVPSGLPQTAISGSVAGYTSFGKYVPKRIHNLEELPKPVRATLEAYLDNWLGRTMRDRFKFVGGQFANKEDFARAYPEAATIEPLEWKNFTYNLLFAIAMPEADVEGFVTGVQLDAQGKAITELQFPPTGENPGLAKLRPLKEIYAIGERHRFDPSQTTGHLKYHDINRKASRSMHTTVT